MTLYDDKFKMVEVDEKDCDLIISFDKLRKELKVNVYPREKQKLKLRGKWYKKLGGMGGNLYLKEIK